MPRRPRETTGGIVYHVLNRAVGWIVITVARYVERNALRAKLVERAQDWRWSSI